MLEPNHIQHRITSGFVSIVTDGGTLPAFWAHPMLGGHFPGLVLLHGLQGVDSAIRMAARRLAEAGFYVIAPDLLGGYEKTVDGGDSAEARRAHLAKAGPPRVEAVLGALLTHNHSNGQVAIVGWQMGGELAFESAMKRSDLQAAVIFCGQPDAFLEQIPNDDTPLLAFYGDADPAVVPTTLYKLSFLMDSPHRQLIVYPDVSGEFMDPHAPGYHEVFAADAWIKCYEFLFRYVNPPRGAQTRRAATY